MTEVSSVSERNDLIVQVESLTKSYGQVKAVNGIDLYVKRGEVFSLLGPNGAGKTTTVEILEGLRKADSGKISVLGLDPWRDGYELHKRIGVIPQGFRFFDKSTPREAINYYAELFGKRVNAEHLLKLVDLQDVSNMYFEYLSGGQKQKLGLALAMVNEAEILFLDEPTTGLDPQARRSIWKVIESLKLQGKTVFLTTHYLDEAERLSDKVAIMNHGSIIAYGGPETLVSKYGRSKKLTLEGDEKIYHLLRKTFNLPVIRQNGIIEITLKQSQDLLKIINAIESSGQPYSGLSLKKDTLEDVFITLVGRMKEGELD
ncbi:MAG: ABC transporter ATP-binding protein [Conexivisphaerales archaeon]